MRVVHPLSYLLVILALVMVVVLILPAAPAVSESCAEGDACPPDTPTPPGAPTPEAAGKPFLAPLPAAAPPLNSTVAGPVQVEIRPSPGGRRLTVNGQAVVVTGMNYNVNYTGLPVKTKQALHQRDFQIMRDAGVNAIVGWGVYDEVTLEVAAQFGIGIIMPFDMDPQGAYENPDYREQVKSDFRAYVNRFKGYPAVWAWNPGGDELLYRMDSIYHRTVDKLQVAADFLIELSALAYSLDPLHVEVIKEPRDFYNPYLDAAIKQRRGQPQQADPSTYLIFGVNVYGHPDDVTVAIQAAKGNAQDRMDLAFLVTEYGPFELPPQDRAMYYGLLWDAVYALCPNGGMVYVFGPDQPNREFPNPYDPLHLLPNEFSLVDNQGRPVDDALATLAARYRAVPH